MSTRVVLTLPDEVYQRAARLAQLTGRDIAAALADALALFLPSFNPLSTSSKPVTDLTDEDIVALIELQMPPEQDEALSAFLHSQQAGELSDTERTELGALLQLYQEGLLRKAKALREAVRRGLHEPLEP
jgi:hypothetical protein